MNVVLYEIAYPLLHCSNLRGFLVKSQFFNHVRYKYVLRKGKKIEQKNASKIKLS